MTKHRYVLAITLLTAGCAVASESTTQKTQALTGGRARCGTKPPNAADTAATDAVVATESSAATPVSSASSRQGVTFANGHTTVIPVYIHIITNSAGEGDVTSRVPQQMSVLNASFAKSGFRFDVKAVEKIANDSWHTAAANSVEEQAMKNALRRGGPDALNIYTGVNDGSLLGWATYPWDYKKSPKLDGVVIDWGSMPGGSLAFPASGEPDGIMNYSGGKTGVHEIGHWLGLYHTFENHDLESGCDGRGDYVLDTPAEAEPQYFCIARDSCTGRGELGTDPIHNYMDYVDDDCMTHFTLGQTLRAQIVTRIHRRSGN
jgi:hypothetical protein